MKTNKIISAEFRKILSRPGIYIVSILLAAVMVFCAFTFNPSVRSVSYSDIQKDTVSEIYNMFTNDDLYKPYCDSLVSSTNDYIDTTSSGNSIKTSIDNAYNNYVEALNNYSYYVKNDISHNTRNVYRSILHDKLKLFQAQIFDQGADLTSSGEYRLLMDIDDYNSVKQKFSELNLYLTQQASTSGQHTANLKKAEEFKSFISTKLNNFIYPAISNKNLDKIAEIRTECEARLTNYTTDMRTLIDSLNSEDSQKSIANRKKMNSYIEGYYKTSMLYSNLITDTVKEDTLGSYSNNEINKFKFFEDYDKYVAQESFTRNNYLWQSKTFDTTYALPIAFNSASNLNGANAYDFMFYALEIFSFIILIYVIYLACNSIAGERSDGTLKLIAIKPISRNKIYRGKLLFCTYISLILLAFSSVVAFIVGLFMYGTTSASILVVFNAMGAFTIHPVLYMLFYLISLFIKLFVFINLGMLISSLINNGTVASMIGLLLYFVDLVAGMLIQSANILRFMPLSNLDLIPFFGNMTLGNQSNLLAKLFATTTPMPAIIWVTISTIICLILISNTLGKLIFKRKDLA